MRQRGGAAGGGDPDAGTVLSSVPLAVVPERLNQVRIVIHVKLASVERTKAREARLLHDFAPQRYAKPQVKVEAVPVQVVHIQPAKNAEVA